ncbi:hypothetical protein HYY75_03540, partial [bacterium]|nr:hypothetical protein [bacterium]
HGREVITKLDDKTLKHIAKETKASFFRASDGRSAQEVARKLDELKRVAMAAQTQMTVSEWFSFPALIAFLILLVEWMVSEKIPYSREKDHWLKRL